MPGHTIIKTTLLIAIVMATCCWTPLPAAAQTNSPVIADLNRLILKINAKLNAGERNEAEFTNELKEFDALLAAHKGEKTAELAEIHRMKAQLFLQVFNDPEMAIAPLRQIKNDFPQMQINGDTDAFILAVEKMATVRKIQRTLVEGAPFPDFDEKDIAGNPLSVAGCKGNVVLIDFWATWCPPCQIELPNILATYKKYHDQGFEVIGISLDVDRQQLEKFLKIQQMTWPQYNDGKFWDTKLVLKYGVTQLPSTYLVDGRGIIIAKELRGDALEAAVAKALAKK